MSDDVVWNCIRHGHCSFMAKIETVIFCRNPYNATGICSRSSCPLANSRYATIRDHDGAERAHLPKKSWERVKLPRNYEKAIEVIDKHLEFWPKLLVHKIKQHLTKMTQYRIRMRKLQLKVREKVVTVPRKKAQRELKREDHALTAAQIDNVVSLISFQEDEEEYVIADDMETEMEDMEDFEGLLNSRLGNPTEDHDPFLELPAKKQKQWSPNSRSVIGRWSRKVITELEQDEDAHNRQRTLV